MAFPGSVICNAHNHDGSMCGNPARKGKTKCRKHGGNSLSGQANPNYRSGRYSTSLPARLASRYEEARANPRLLSVQDDLAVCEARLAELFTQVESGETGQRWAQLQAAATAFREAQALGHVGRMNQAFETLTAVVQAGAQSAAACGEIQTLWETRCKLVQTEMKTLQGMQQMVSVQQMMLWMGAITQAVTDIVQKEADVKTARRILQLMQDEFTRLATVAER